MDLAGLGLALAATGAALQAQRVVHPCEQISVRPTSASWIELMRVQASLADVPVARREPVATLEPPVVEVPGPHHFLERRSMDPMDPAVERLGPGGCSGFAVEPPIGAAFDGQLDGPDGLGFSFIPPDVAGGVGPGHLMTMLNNKVLVQNRFGSTTLSVDTNVFWSPAGATPATPTILYPRVAYDAASGRWLASARNGITTTGSTTIFFAISRTNNPTGVWDFYSFPADPLASSFADWVLLGYNSAWITIPTNMFNLAGAFLGAKMWTIDKSTALSMGGPITVSIFPTGFMTTAHGSGGSSPHPARTLDGDPTLWMINDGFTSGGVFLLQLTRITGTGAAPMVSGLAGSPFGGTTSFCFVTHNFSGTQRTMAQLTETRFISAFSVRIASVAVRNGKIWVANSGGLPGPSSNTSPTSNGVLWHQLDPTLPFPASSGAPGSMLVQSGQITNGVNTMSMYPSIVSNCADDVLVGYANGDATRHPRACYSIRLGTDALGFMGAINELKAGESTYWKNFGVGTTAQYGRYTSAAVDPNDDKTLWTIQEYADTRVGPADDDSRWGTHWGRFSPQSGWTGAMDRDWTNASNWTDGVPDSTTSVVIPDVANDPLVSDDSQACNALLLEPGALLELDGSFAVHGGATIYGTIPGTGELRAEGSGTFTGTGTISVKTIFNQDITVQGGPLTIANDLDVHEDLTLAAGSKLVVSGTADMDPAATAVLSGDGTLDLNGSVDLRMSDGASVPRLELAGDLTIDSSVFTPASGTVRFDGAAAQTVTQLSGGATQLFEVEVAAASDVTVGGDLSLTGDLTLDGDLSVGDDFELGGDLDGGTMSNLAAGCNMSFGGNIEHQGGLSSSCMIVINEPSAVTLTVDVTNPFPTDLDVQVGGRLLLLSDLTVQGELRLVDGILSPGLNATLDVHSMVIEAGASLETEGFAVALAGAPPVTVRGELSVEPGSVLELSASPVSIESGGTLRVVRGTVRGLSGGGYALTVGAGATLAAREFVFQEMGINGVVVDRNALLAAKPLDLRLGLFSRPALNGTLLSIDRAAATSLRYLRFENPLGISPANNVTVTGGAGATITILNPFGTFAGPGFEKDPNGRLEWGSSKLLPPETSGSSAAGGSAPLGGGTSPNPGSGPGSGGSGSPAPIPLVDGAWGELVLGPGTYPAFWLEGGRGGSLRLAAQGNARITTAGGPVEIRGLESDEVVELCGLELSGGAGPALLIEDSRGVVRLEHCRIEGDVRLAAASAVLLDECTAWGLALMRGSQAHLRGGRIEAAELVERSRLDSWGVAAAVGVAPGSHWSRHGSSWPQLEFTADEAGLRLDLPPGSLAWVASSTALDLGSSRSGWVLIERDWVPHGLIHAGETLRLGPFDPTSRPPRFFQALVLGRSASSASNVVSCW